MILNCPLGHVPLHHPPPLPAITFFFIWNWFTKFFCCTYDRTTSLIIFVCGCESLASAGLSFRCGVKRRPLVIKPVQMLRDVFDMRRWIPVGTMQAFNIRSSRCRKSPVFLVWRAEMMPTPMKRVLTSATVKRHFVFVVVVSPVSDSSYLENGTSSRGPRTSRGSNRGQAVAIWVLPASRCLPWMLSTTLSRAFVSVILSAVSTYWVFAGKCFFQVASTKSSEANEGVSFLRCV